MTKRAFRPQAVPKSPAYPTLKRVVGSGALAAVAACLIGAASTPAARSSRGAADGGVSKRRTEEPVRRLLGAPRMPDHDRRSHAPDAGPNDAGQ